MAFPTTGLLDSFNRADSSPLNGNWNPQTHLDTWDTNADLVSNRAGNTICSATWLTATGADCEAYAVIPVLVTGARARISARLTTQTAAASGYSADWDAGAPQFDLIRWDAGSGAIIASSALLSMIAGDSLGIACTGSTIQCWHKTGGTWVKRVELTDATYAAGGFLQFGFGGTGFFVDDFSGGTQVLGGPGDNPPMGVLGRGAGW